ncbi:MAG TPA: hypothetical protein DEQ43_00835 [Nocardioides bacterium]|nr:hypothetical protein [Nocardioides sp.]
MTAELARPRPALLPHLERSRAVLVACDDPEVRPQNQPSVRAGKLARALCSPAAGMAFHPSSVLVLTSWPEPDSVLVTLRRAAAEASDVLLVHYVDTGAWHRETARPLLRDVAEIVWAAPAARRVVLLECGDFLAALDWFTHDPRPRPVGPSYSITLLGLSTFGSPHRGEEFTATLAAALQSGVADSPDLLEMATLRAAVEARWAEICFSDATECSPGPGKLLHIEADRVALGTNVAVRPFHDRPARPFPPDPATVLRSLMEWD